MGHVRKRDENEEPTRQKRAFVQCQLARQAILVTCEQALSPVTVKECSDDENFADAAH